MAFFFGGVSERNYVELIDEFSGEIALESSIGSAVNDILSVKLKIDR